MNPLQLADPDVWNAITAAALSNNMTAGAAYYTDVAGNLLTNGGTIAPTTASAVVVGSAPAGIPPCNDPSKCVDGRASGVRVIGTKTVDTYVAEWAYHDLDHLRQILSVLATDLYPHIGPFQALYAPPT